jgi:hypothetical protein
LASVTAKNALFNKKKSIEFSYLEGVKYHVKTELFQLKNPFVKVLEILTTQLNNKKYCFKIKSDHFKIKFFKAANDNYSKWV